MDALPPIRYATTTDGFRIAFYAVGKGPPVLLLRPHPSSHLTLEWQSPTSQEFYRWLARHVTLIRLDFRGAGLSERQVSGLTLKSIADDINSVVDRLALERVGILSNGGFAGICALSYAASFPERVSRIVCVDVSQGESELNRAVTDLRMASPSVHSRVRASVMVGSLGSAADAAALTAIYEESTDSTGHKAFVELTRTTDIQPSLPRVEAPTLFMHTEGNEIFPITVAQEMAAVMRSAALHIRPKGSASSSLAHEAEWQIALAFLLARNAEASIEWAVKERGNDSSATERGRRDGLSRREADVLRQVALGRTNQEIASELVISRSTVSHHLTNIFRKTNSANRTEAAGYAHRHGFM